MLTPASRRRAPIAILTDFGYRDHYVGAMKGVISSIAPAATIVDITHGIPPQQIIAGALGLRECVEFFPRGTVFLAVVDPGVGTNRLPIALETRNGMRMVGPDNGLLWPAAERAKIKAIVELRASRYRLPDVSATFHGRDLFAPAAAWLWRGLALRQLGPPLDAIVRLEPEVGVVETKEKLSGSVIYVDSFGNLVTNISRARVERFAERFRGCRLSFRVRSRASLKLYKAYGDAPPGVPLAIFGSFGLLEIAVRDGSAAAYFTVKPGAPVVVRAERQPSTRH
ncbi:MAG TPA: SAM-dependent chlorinase/fluorinase [Candidatus Binataceae bacterium]|nr:SAM-dependent chlorinase/fluorinase [Candidatus Binataceae bacterium]